MSEQIKPEYMALLDDCPECKATVTQALDGFDYSKALAMLEQRTDLTDEQRSQALTHLNNLQSTSTVQDSSNIKEYTGGQL